MADLWIEVDLDAVKHNYRQIISRLSTGCKVMAVVKADAYGLGAVEVSKSLEEEGCHNFAVTNISEALTLRREGIESSILVLGPTGSQDWSGAIAQNIEITVSRLDWIPLLNDIAAKEGKTAGIHLKIETGMGRTGFNGDDLQELAQALQEAPLLDVKGAYTHFARAAQRNNDYTREQHEKFSGMVSSLENYGLEIPLKHVCNSAAYLDFPEYHYDMVRVGTLLGGHFPSPAFAKMLNLQDPWKVKARILHLQKVSKGTFVGYQSIYKSKRETTLAVIAAGYADGFGIEPRFVPQGIVDLGKIIIKNTAALFGWQLGREKVLLGGHAVKVAGKVGMQLTVIDVEERTCTAGDEIVIPIRRTLANPRIPRYYKKNGEINRIRIIFEGFLSVEGEFSYSTLSTKSMNIVKYD